jgi:hypothetical protein
MKKGKKQKRPAKPLNKRVASTAETATAAKQRKPAAKVSSGIRAKAAHRTAEGKFTKIIFNHIGGKECPRFAVMTWTERDAFIAKPENAAVRGRYEKQMVSVAAN